MCLIIKEYFRELLSPALFIYNFLKVSDVSQERIHREVVVMRYLFALLFILIQPAFMSFAQEGNNRANIIVIDISQDDKIRKHQKRIKDTVSQTLFTYALDLSINLSAYDLPYKLTNFISTDQCYSDVEIDCLKDTGAFLPTYLESADITTKVILARSAQGIRKQLFDTCKTVVCTYSESIQIAEKTDVELQIKTNIENESYIYSP